MGFNRDLKLVGTVCHCPVESNHAGSDLPWRMAVVLHLHLFTGKLCYSLLGAPPQSSSFHSRFLQGLGAGCPAQGGEPYHCRVVALELACLAGSAGAWQEWEPLAWKGLTDQLYFFFPLYKCIGLCRVSTNTCLAVVLY